MKAMRIPPHKDRLFQRVLWISCGDIAEGLES